jgi:hypothetical protein
MFYLFAALLNACDSSSFDHDTDYSDGQGVGHAPGADASDCCQQCDTVPGCNFFTFAPIGTKGSTQAMCWFKASDAGRREFAGCISGRATPPPPPPAHDYYIIDDAGTGPSFDGHGGLSAGASSRLLIDYPEPQRAEILDYLFKPGFGASLDVLKLEIGGDTQSTDGTEASHMHARGDLNCNRGYEGWLAREAKARNPSIKVWSLSWGVPGWIGNVSGQPPTYYSDDEVDYQVAWLRCLRDAHGVESDYLGLWNERPQGSVYYVKQLRAALDTRGFGGVGITVEATWQNLIDNVLTDPQFNASVAAATKHYPCNETSEPALQAHKKFWAGEDTPTPCAQREPNPQSPEPARAQPWPGD